MRRIVTVSTRRTSRRILVDGPFNVRKGERRLRRVRYRAQPDGVFLGSGSRQERVSRSMADDVGRPPANGRKAEAPLLAVETRHCEGCDADFRPARPWSRFCGPARRLSAPIAALFTLGKILIGKTKICAGIVSFADFSCQMLMRC